MLKNAMNKKKKGFTLIELVIVIAIIAILSAIALPKLMEVRETANVKSDIANAKNIQLAVATLVTDEKIATGHNFSLSTVSDATVALVLNNLQDSPKLKAKASKSSQFLVNIDAVGNIKVYYGAAGATTAAATNLIYPAGAGVYNIK